MTRRWLLSPVSKIGYSVLEENRFIMSLTNCLETEIESRVEHFPNYLHLITVLNYTTLKSSFSAWKRWWDFQKPAVGSSLGVYKPLVSQLLCSCLMGQGVVSSPSQPIPNRLSVPPNSHPAHTSSSLDPTSGCVSRVTL